MALKPNLPLAWRHTAPGVSGGHDLSSIIPSNEKAPFRGASCVSYICELSRG